MSEYESWAIRHIRAFGLTDQAIETFIAWGPVFTRLFSCLELNTATDELLINADLKPFASDHRGAIVKSIETERRRARSKSEDAQPHRGCSICDATGWAIVPHPGTDRFGNLIGFLQSPRNDSRSVSREMAVSCSCDRGERLRVGFQERDKEKTPLSLNVYIERYPDWELVLAERKAVKAAEFERPQATDPERLKRELADGFRMPRKK